MGTIDQEIKANFMNERHRLLANITFTSAWMHNMFNDFLKPFKLSSQQFNILRILRGTGDWMPMNDVKGRMVDRSPNATRLVDKLLQKGYLERQRSEKDRRVVFIKISEAGLDLLEEIDKAGEPEAFKASNKITEEEANMVNDILNRLRG